MDNTEEFFSAIKNLGACRNMTHWYIIALKKNHPLIYWIWIFFWLKSFKSLKNLPISAVCPHNNISNVHIVHLYVQVIHVLLIKIWTSRATCSSSGLPPGPHTPFYWTDRKFLASVYCPIWQAGEQSSWWEPVLRTKTSKALCGPVNFSVFI